MNKFTFLSIVICILCLTFVTSCGGSVPSSDEYVKILPMQDRTITYDELISVLSKHNIEIPFYVSKSGTVIHAVVIPFDIQHMSGDVTYDEVRVTMTILERDETKFYDETGNIAVLTAIPQSVDRSVAVEESSKIAFNFAAAVSELSGNVGAEQSKKESYARLYRKVTANLRSPTLVSWVFTPFKDEPIFPGTYYVIAIIEVRDQTHEFLAQVHANCTYGAPTWFGLSRDSRHCTSDPMQLILIEVADIL